MPNSFSANIKQSYEKMKGLRKRGILQGTWKNMYYFMYYVFLTFTYLGSCGNMLNQQMSDGLSHLQGCSSAALQPRLFGLNTRRMHVSAFFSCTYSGGNYSKFIQA